MVMVNLSSGMPAMVIVKEIIVEVCYRTSPGLGGSTGEIYRGQSALFILIPR